MSSTPGAAPGEGYDWGTQTHGIHVDHEDNVWVGFGGGLPLRPVEPRHDGQRARPEVHSRKAGSCCRSATSAGAPKEVAARSSSASRRTYSVDPASDEIYVSDGYTNRRLNLVFDSNTGEYRRHWSAYGNPPDDGPQPPFSRDGPLPRQFNTPHCVGRAADGRVYVCDRGNQRLQVFEPDGTFVTEALNRRGAA